MAKINLVCSCDSGYFFYGHLDYRAGIQINIHKSLAVSPLVSFLDGIGYHKDCAAV